MWVSNQIYEDEWIVQAFQWPWQSSVDLYVSSFVQPLHVPSTHVKHISTHHELPSSAHILGLQDLVEVHGRMSVTARVTLAQCLWSCSFGWCLAEGWKVATVWAFRTLSEPLPFTHLSVIMCYICNIVILLRRVSQSLVSMLLVHLTDAEDIDWWIVHVCEVVESAASHDSWCSTQIRLWLRHWFHSWLGKVR